MNVEHDPSQNGGKPTTTTTTTVVVPVIRVANPDPDHHIIYTRKCSVGLGITLLVFGAMFVVLGGLEFATNPWATMGCGLIEAVLLLAGGAVLVLTGMRTSKITLTVSLVVSTIMCAVHGICVALWIARIIVVCIAIPIGNSDAPDYYYYFDRPSDSNNTDAYEYDYANARRVPTKYNPKVNPSPDYLLIGVIMGIETLLILAAFILSIIGAAQACRSRCGGVKVMPKVIVLN